MTSILGVSAFYHDSAAAVVIDGNIIGKYVKVQCYAKSPVRNNKTLIYFSLAPCIYIAIYGIYLVIGPVDLYEDGSKNFFLKNPEEKELPIVFIILKFYQYILIIVGSTFSYLFIKYLIKKKI